MAEHFLQSFYETTDGARLYFQVQGPPGAPGLVMMDGIGCDGFIWRHLRPFLNDRYRILHWHYRGHGRSTLAEDPARLGLQYNCRDLDRIMDAAGMGRATLVGHSMGVQVSLEFHRRYRHRVEGLVLVNGSYGRPLDTFGDTNLLRRLLPLGAKFVHRFPKQIGALTSALSTLDIAVETAFLLEMNRALLDRVDAARYMRHALSMNPVVFLLTLESLATHSAWDHLPHIDVPTLVVGSEKDHFTPLWLSQRMAQRIPGAEFLFLKDGTHVGPLDFPNLVNPAVDRFLSQRVQQAAVRAS